MSCVLTLTSIAIIASISLSTTATLIAVAESANEHEIEEGFETVFADSELLIKTLNGFDCCTDIISENEIVVKAKCGNLRYRRDDISQAFKMYLDEIDNPDELIENIRSFEEDYGRNVQAYTYNHIKENLTDSMSIESEEILDDDTMVLTINI